MIFVDTGYLIALVSPADAHHARAVAWSRHVSSPFVVTEYVLIETLNLLSRPRDRGRAVALADRVRRAADFEFVAATNHLFESGMTLYRQRHDKAWSITDCLSFVAMRERGLTQVLAYDAHFLQAGFDPLLRRDPA